MAKRSNNWKKVEYKVAKILGGKRVPVSGRAEVIKGDVEHSKYFVEVKTGNQVPKKVLKWNRQIEIGHRILKEDFDGILKLNKKDIPKTIMDWFEKAEGEAPKEKIVLLIMKPKYCHDEYVLWKKDNSKFLFTTLTAFASKFMEKSEQEEEGQSDEDGLKLPPKKSFFVGECLIPEQTTERPNSSSTDTD